MILRQLFDSETSTYTYLLGDEKTRDCALIDPVQEHVNRDLKLIQELGLNLTYTLETHIHADHVTSSGMLADKTGALAAASEHGAACATVRLRHGSKLSVGNIDVRVIATPGHTYDSLSFYVPGHVFTGDSLLIRGTGRTDFQSGNAGQLYDSIAERLFVLPDNTSVWPGHDYRGHTVSTILEEKRYNPRLAGKSREEFVALMRALKLPAPKKIQVAVPANLVCGRGAQVIAR